MQDMTWDRVERLKALLIAATVAFSVSACTTTNPVTGQQQVDYGATAGVAGAAMGAAALGVALSNNNNDRVVYGGPGWGGNRATRVNNVNVNRSVNNRVTRVNHNANLNQPHGRHVHQGNLARGGNRNLNRAGNRGRGNRRSR